MSGRRLIGIVSTLILMLGISGLVRAADVQAPPANRTAEQMMADYKAAQPAEPDREKIQTDTAYRDQFIKDYQAALEKQRKLGRELLDTYPDSPDAAQIMGPIWVQSALESPKETLSQIDRFIAASKNEKNVKQAKYFHAMIILRGPDDNAKKLDAVNQFIADAPDMKVQAASLLMGYAAKLPPAESKVVLQRVVTEYADTEVAAQAQGALRLADAQGKPFELEFTDAISGDKISTKDLKGKVIVVDFWATWCGPCVGEMPTMKKLYGEFKDKGVQFIGVSLDQPEADGGLKALKDFVAKNEITWPQYYQGKGWASEFSRGWGINSIPRVFVIDADGNLSSTQGRGQLETIIPKLLEKRDQKTTG